jgi:CRISPR/Cas system CSM-associated protein Csm3 (group 7 of RAMP superfamily)
MSFANPYNFVGIDENNIQTRDDRWLRHDKYETNWGKLICNITFLSDFIIAGTNNQTSKSQMTINSMPIIPASSLKGLLRATAEAMSNSCLSIMSDKYKYKFMRGMPEGTSKSSNVEYKKVTDERGRELLVFEQKPLVEKNALINSCDKNGLCIACKLFGRTAKEDPETNESFNYGGKVRIYDAKYLGECNVNGQIINKSSWQATTKYLKQHSLSNPQNHHESFYLNGNKIKGRKFYYHRQVDAGKIMSSSQQNATTMYLAKKDSVFQFEISFENLTDEEYGLLLRTLELEEGLGHKIGMAKPLGLGSCIICLKEIKEFSKNRYLNLNETGTVYSGTGLKTRKNIIMGYWTTPFPDDLKCILKIDNGFSEIRYPNKDIHNPERNEFLIYKKLHPPCREFSDDDKQGSAPIFTSNHKSPERKYDKRQSKGGGAMAEAFSKAKKKKEKK